ncbi:MAG TPA: NBR1-Ig-like domain-containing protein [Anaerolineales bacterium]|nr:NBR1-Ig-like domain-containing protein [Anaerolineales bacterium]
MFFRNSPRQILLTLLTAALILTACNVGAAPSPTLDINAINTAIVGTTVAQFSAQFTQTALAVPPATNTPTPTNTPQELPTFALPTVSFLITPTIAGAATPLPGFTPIASPAAPGATQALGDECSNNVFEGDVTIPDGEIIAPGTDFQKIWKIRNTGNCIWDDGYTLVYIGGSTPNLDPYNFEFKKVEDFVSSGEAINIGINLTTPCAPGKYEGHWRMRNDKGYYFGTILSVYVEVKEKCK